MGSRENLTQRQIGSTIREFRSRLAAGSVALFFYAGHGLQVEGANYLPCVDADIASEDDVPTQSIEVMKVLDAMEAQKIRLKDLEAGATPGAVPAPGPPPAAPATFQPPAGTARVCRGGSWFNAASVVRASRRSQSPDGTEGSLGFRLAASLE